MSRKESFAKGQAALVTRHSIWFFAAFLLLTVLTVPYAARLKLDANFLDLLPEQFPSIADVNWLTERIGGTSYLIAVFESETEAAAKEAAERFAGKMETVEGVSYVDNRTDTGMYENRKFLFLSMESLDRIDKYVNALMHYYRRKTNPFYIDLLNESPPELDRSSLKVEHPVYSVGGLKQENNELHSHMQIVLVKPDYPISDFAHTGEVFREAEEVFQSFSETLPAKVKLTLTGPYKTRYDEYVAIMADLKWTGMLTILFVFVIMMAFFRRLSIILLSFAALTAGIIWTCAFAFLAIGYLNLISAFLLAILFGLGIDFAVHLLMNYQEYRANSKNARDAFEKTFAAIWYPALTSAVTSSIAFYSLMISQFNGFNHFGLIAGTGILLCFASVFYGLPSVIILYEKWFKWRPPHSTALFEMKWVRSWHLPIYLILIGGTAFTVFSLLQIRNLEFDYNFRNLQTKNLESIKIAPVIEEHFGIILNPAILTAQSREEADALAKMLNFYIEGHSESSFDFAASLMSHVPDRQAEKIEKLEKIDERIQKYESIFEELEPQKREELEDFKKQLHPEPFGIDELPEGLRKQYEGTQGDLFAVYVYPKESLLDGKVAKEFVRELRALDLPAGTKLIGEPVVYADILILLERDAWRAMFISLAMLLIVLFVHFQKLSSVLWVLAPVVTGFVWMIGLIGSFGFKLNYLNITILPSILGVGIDNGIHIFHRYKRENKGTFTDIMQKTGKKVIAASLVAMAAFASIIFARHQGMSSMGMIGFIGFGCCLVTSVILIPALIEFLEMKYWNRLPKSAQKKS